MPLRIGPLALHLGAAVAMAAAFVAAYTLAGDVFAWSAADPMTFAAAFWRRLPGWLPFQVMAYAAVVGAGHAAVYAREVAREQREKAELATQLVEAQLGALRMQLQPHFLFNTLNSVAMLVRGADHARAVEMIAQLGDVLRALLRRSADLEAPLASELEFLERYLAIEQVRFGERLSIAWRIAGDAAPAFVPPLILQPLVENALRHGLWPSKAGGELAIRAERRGDALELEVADGGVGLPADFDLARASGVGLANVRDRLARMYGGAAAIELGARASGGTSVRLTLPFRAAAGAR